MESKLAQVSRPCKQTRQGCTRHERGGSASLRCKKVNSRGLADRARLQEARARWLGELKVHESKLAGVSIPDKVARGTREVAQQTCDAGKKVISHGLADPVRLKEARARWLGELAVQESCTRHERGGSANLRCRKVSFHGLADRARLQDARGRWRGELSVPGLKEARARWLGKIAMGTREMAQRTCGARKKVNSHRLADPARLKEARARWLGKIAMQESKLARVSRPGKVARGTREVARRTCGAGKKVNSHRLADPARLKEARARWLGKIAMQESKLARVSRPGKVARRMSEVAQRTCGAGKHERGGSAILRCKKLNSHGLTNPARLKETRATWLGELAVLESKLEGVSSPGKVARGTNEVARRTCGARK
ncbi:hypothetical protein CRG98_042172 [Punica granatum]|uniref:Uncharacterized protein n=1 Tax=Punica granatum TaxID=22663 RepID=A0A2I0I0G0_PUNGR|nr:hypothetical protein CRG98_042172 [Punica granatum]